MPWEHPPYKDGSIQGTAAWRCARTWFSLYWHMQSRSVVLEDMSKRPKFREDFHAAADRFIVALKSGSRIS